MSVELERILQENNLFSILCLTSDASTDEIRTAYKKLVKEVHPDRFVDSLEKTKAEEAFKRLGVAFNTLRDPLLRKDYERSIERFYTPPSKPKPPPERQANGPASAPPNSSRPPSSSPNPNRPQGTGPMQPPPRPQGTGKTREQTLAEQAEKHYAAGRDFERKNQMDDAIKEYQEAIRLKKGVAQYHSRLGLALEKKGWTGYAQAEYKVALHFDPTDQLALKSYKPTAGTGQAKGAGFKFLNIFRGDKGMRIGDILIQLGHLNKEQLQKALKQQSDEKLLLGEILIRMKYIKPEHLAQALIHQADNQPKEK